MEENTELLTVDTIRKRVYVIRGKQVMLDQDLAVIYGYELKAMNQQVKRNIERFPEDFMFQLSDDEYENLKSQFVTSSWGGRRKLPYVFTEQGIYMLATVLKGDLAIQQSIFIMRVFRELRHYVRQNQQFVTQAEIGIVTARVFELSVQVAGIADRQIRTEKDVQHIQKCIDVLNEKYDSSGDRQIIVGFGQSNISDCQSLDLCS